MLKKKYIKYSKKILNLLQFGGDDSSNSSDSESTYTNTSTSTNTDTRETEPELIKVISLGLSKREKEIINNIKINNSYSIMLHYDNEKNVYSSIIEYIKKIGDNSNISEDVANIIVKIIKNAIAHENEKSGIIWLRATVERKDEFRWHRDGKHISFDEKKPIYKFACTLKGESTPVVIDRETIQKFNEVSQIKDEFENCIWNYIGKNNIDIYDIRMELFDEIRKLTDPPLIKAIGNNYVQKKTLDEGVFFLTMNNGASKVALNEGVIHSEPKIQKDRLFLAVLPGQKDKCAEWVEKNTKKNK
jgi:ribosomal protein L14